MSAATRAVEVLLAITVISAWICCVGLVVLQDFYERLHYMATVSTISMFALLAAVVVEEGWGQATLKTILIVFVVFLMNAVLTHATARAARIRELGHWTPDPKENIPGAKGRGGKASQKERKKNE